MSETETPNVDPADDAHLLALLILDLANAGAKIDWDAIPETAEAYMRWLPMSFA